MGRIVTPRIQTVQPSPGMQINTANPLTKGLAFVLNSASPRLDLISKTTGTDSTTGFIEGVGPFGRMVQGAAGGAPPYRSWTGFTTATAYTVATVCLDKTGRGASRNTLDSDAGSGVYRNFQFRFETNNFPQFIPFNTSASPFTVTGTTASSATNLSVMLGVVDNAQVARVYLNGVTTGGTNTITGTVSTLAATEKLAIGGYLAGADQHFAGDIYLSVFWNRALSQAEITSFSNNPWQLFQAQPLVLSWADAAGIAFNAAANSGDVAAASSYSGSASWAGTNRMLAIDVSMLGPGVTVTAMTYGGANCTFIGAQSTVTSFGRVEQWRITSTDSGAPAAGANTLSVTLSGSLEFSVEWASYTGVHQTSPTEGFNSAQATNAGSATDASVAITSTADNCWIHAAVTANDTSITANQTSRNNISGTLGSGANEDNNAPKTPAGAVTMSYTGMGITTTWAIAGYAIRPIAASSTFSAAWGKFVNQIFGGGYTA